MNNLEHEQRLFKVKEHLTKADPNWGTILLTGRLNQYYLTGTMQDGLLVICHNGKLGYFVRRGYERAKAESPFAWIYPMDSYKDIVNVFGNDYGRTYLETEIATVGMLNRLKKAFQFEEVFSIDRIMLEVRAVKSDYELAFLRKSGNKHRVLLEEVVPNLLKEGMSEFDLSGEIQHAMLRLGYHGVTRFGMYQAEVGIGQLGFGENALVRTSFDGPGGMQGMSAAVPIVGSRERKLSIGDMVFVDIGFGVEGYHTDRTQMYRFGAEPTEKMVQMHRLCMDIQQEAAAALKPGNLPSEIYRTALTRVPMELMPNFMGNKGQNAKFLGHGVGLQMDEYPILASGFDEPLAAGMVVALEPKIALAGVGLVGVEDTYLVTDAGGESLTHGCKTIMVVR